MENTPSILVVDDVQQAVETDVVDVAGAQEGDGDGHLLQALLSPLGLDENRL